MPRLLTKPRSQRDAFSDDGNKISHYEDEVRDKVGQLPSNQYKEIASIYFVNLAMTIEEIFAIINRYAFSCALKNYFEIISRFFMAFYIIIVDFINYLITNYLREDSLKNDLGIFSLNYLENVSLKLGNYSLNFLESVSLNYLEKYSLANFFGVNNFIKLNDFVKRHLRDDFLFNRKINSKKI